MERSWTHASTTVEGVSVLSPDAAMEILETGREALRIKEPIPAERVFDFSLADEALK
jgi:hypothetical protein